MKDRFVVSTNEIGEIIVTDVETDRVYRYDDPSNFFGLIRLLNEQQATIRKLQDLCGESDGENAKLRMKNNEQKVLIINLQGDVNRLQYIIDELRKDNYKRFEKINELKAKLKEKEEDERLYANEIVELRKTNEEWLEFKELGGDY